MWSKERKKELAARMLQYSTLTSTSSGVLQTERRFLSMKIRRDMKMSAMEPVRKVRVARLRPMMVRY